VASVEAGVLRIVRMGTRRHPKLALLEDVPDGRR
jgi:hypothetical protein